MTDEADKKLASWAYWMFKTFEDPTTQAGSGEEGFYNADGSIQAGKVQMLARTYIQAAQGTIQEQQFQAEDGSFDATILLDSSIDEPTVVHALTDSAHGEPVWYTDADEHANIMLSVRNESGDLVPIDDSLIQWSGSTLLNKYAFQLDSSLDGELINIHI